MESSENVIKSCVTAGMCTLWMILASKFNLIGWAGFAGCTAYFAFSKSGIEAVKHTSIAILSGSIYGLISILISSKIAYPSISLLLTFVTTFLMCYAGKTRYLSYVPAAFIGSFSTFAAAGNIVIIPSLILGVILGLICDTLGNKLVTVSKN